MTHQRHLLHRWIRSRLAVRNNNLDTFINTHGRLPLVNLPGARIDIRLFTRVFCPVDAGSGGRLSLETYGDRGPMPVNLTNTGRLLLRSTEIERIAERTFRDERFGYAWRLARKNSDRLTLVRVDGALVRMAETSGEAKKRGDKWRFSGVRNYSSTYCP